MQDAKCCSPDMCGSAPLTFPAHCHSTEVLWQCAGKVRGADPHMSGEQIHGVWSTGPENTTLHPIWSLLYKCWDIQDGNGSVRMWLSCTACTLQYFSVLCSTSVYSAVLQYCRVQAVQLIHICIGPFASCMKLIWSQYFCHLSIWPQKVGFYLRYILGSVQILHKQLRRGGGGKPNAYVWHRSPFIYYTIT